MSKAHQKGKLWMIYTYYRYTLDTTLMYNIHNKFVYRSAQLLIISNVDIQCLGHPTVS